MVWREKKKLPKKKKKKTKVKFLGTCYINRQQKGHPTKKNEWMSEWMSLKWNGMDRKCKHKRHILNWIVLKSAQRMCFVARKFTWFLFKKMLLFHYSSVWLHLSAKNSQKGKNTHTHTFSFHGIFIFSCLCATTLDWLHSDLKDEENKNRFFLLLLLHICCWCCVLMLTDFSTLQIRFNPVPLECISIIL